MEQRTCNIIMICKQGYKSISSHLADRYDLVRRYIADECGCQPTDYNYATMAQIIETAVIDVMASCEKPAALLQSYFNHLKYSDSDKDPLKTWLVALNLLQVKEKIDNDTYRYVNGFSKDLIEQAKKIIK